MYLSLMYNLISFLSCQIELACVKSQIFSKTKGHMIALKICDYFYARIYLQ